MPGRFSSESRERAASRLWTEARLLDKPAGDLDSRHSGRNAKVFGRHGSSSLLMAINVSNPENKKSRRGGTPGGIPPRRLTLQLAPRPSAPSCSLSSHPTNSNSLLTGATLNSLSGTSQHSMIIPGTIGKASGPNRVSHPVRNICRLRVGVAVTWSCRLGRRSTSWPLVRTHARHPWPSAHPRGTWLCPP